MIPIFLAGEGATELGGWVRPRPFRSERPERGVLEALVEKCWPTGCEVVDAIRWKDIRKFRSGDRRAPETRNVVGAALSAREVGRRLGLEDLPLVFSRDRDRDLDRDARIEAGIKKAEELGYVVAGGVAAPNIEAWVIACEGRTGSEVVRDPKGDLAERGITSTAEKVAVIDRVEIDALPSDASSLRRWCGRVRALGDASRQRDRGTHGLVPA